MKLDEQFAILQAAKEGKKIRRTPFGEDYAHYIVDAKSHSFDFSSGRYEIVPEPMEIWAIHAGTRKGGRRYFLSELFFSEQDAVKSALNIGGKAVKFREVLDDE